MSNQQEVEDLFASILEKNELILVNLTSSRLPERRAKTVIRPLIIKGQLNYQFTEQQKQQAFHSNYSKEECLKWLKQHAYDFKQTFIFTKSADYHLLVGKKGHLTLLKKPPSKQVQNLIHNRQKNYLLQEGTLIPFLIELGVMNKEGQVYAAKKDKFRQINRFLEMIDDVIPHLDPSHCLNVIDFGCGKAYLTFALYHFLKFTKGFNVQLTGLDLKSEVIQTCQELSQKMGYQQDLQFIHGNIEHYELKGSVDMVVSLHACDTATDAALEKAIRWQAKVILSVPCCQHELLQQIQHDHLSPLLKHGILKERFAALATDAARVQLLEVLGYQAQILEFIDVEHTPKNLLIRAIKRPHLDRDSTIAWKTYFDFKKALHIYPSLEQRFEFELSKY